MKKFISVLLGLCIMLCFISCSKSANDTDAGSNEQAQASDTGEQDNGSNNSNGDYEISNTITIFSDRFEVNSTTYKDVANMNWVYNDNAIRIDGLKINITELSPETTFSDIENYGIDLSNIKDMSLQLTKDNAIITASFDLEGLYKKGGTGARLGDAELRSVILGDSAALTDLSGIINSETTKGEVIDILDGMGFVNVLDDNSKDNYYEIGTYNDNTLVTVVFLYNNKSYCSKVSYKGESFSTASICVLNSTPQNLQ